MVCNVASFLGPFYDQAYGKSLNNSFYETSSRLLTTEAATNNQKPADENPTSETQKVNKEFEGLLAKNEQLLKERNELEDKYKRALAEAENVRKRMLRQVEEAKVFGIQSFCKDLLEVADILSKATESAPEDQLKDGVNPHFRQLFDGLKMTDAQLLKVRQGLMLLKSTFVSVTGFL